MKKINLFSRLWSSGGNSQSTDVGYDSRSTVGSPSGLESSKVLKFVSVLAILLTIGSGNVWGEQLYLNEGATGTSGGVTATGNVNTNAANGNPGNSFANTTSSNTTFTFSGFDLSDYENLELAIDASFKNFPYTVTTYPKVTVTFYKDEVAVLTDNTTIVWSSKDNTYSTYTFSDLPDFDSFTIVGSPSTGKTKAGKSATNYGTYMDNITLTGDEKSSCTPISPSLSYASVGGTTLTVGSSSSGSPTVSGNTGSGAVTYSVTAASPAGCATVNSSTGVVTAVAAGTATITASIAANGGYCSGSATANFTITVPAYTVQFSTGTGNPTVSSRTEASAGAGITLPSGPTPACSGDGWVFMGWKETSAQSSTTTAPDLLAAGSTYHPTSNCTLYAVYYKPADSNPNNFNKVTSNSANLTSGYYVIYANSEAMNNVLTSEKIAGKSVSESSSGVITSTDADIIWTLYKSGDYYQLYNASINKYLEVEGSNNLGLNTTSKGFTLYAFNTTTGQVSLKSVNLTSYQFQYYNGNFSAYGSQSTAIFFYKRGGTYNSNPTCCTPLGSINGSINMTSSTDGTVTISGWTYNAGSTGTTESNVSSYTVKLYKWNGSAWAIANASSTTGGSSGTAATRTGIATDSKSVTYSGLEYGGTYKFTVTAIGTGAYCDGPETAVTSINGNSLTNNEFLNKYSIYIDDGTNSDSGWGHHYIESLSSHTGNVTLNSLTAGATYKFKLTLGSVIWYSANATMTSGNCTDWTFYSNVSENCGMTTGLGGNYIFAINAETPTVSVTYPSASQAADKIIYWDASIHGDAWSKLCFRVGTSSNSNARETAKNSSNLVPGTDQFYKMLTCYFGSMEAWTIANNTGWTGTNSVYRTDDEGDYTVTKSIAYQDYAVVDPITIIPTTSGSAGGSSENDGCTFYTLTKYDGMLTHNISVGSADHGTVVATYTNISGTTGQTVAEGANADLAHRCIVTITATPDAGYQLSSLTVNSAAFTSGNTHILTADATIAATFTAQTYNITLDREGASTGSENVTMTYNSSSHTAITAPTKTGYNFGGWYSGDNGTGSQVMNASGVLQVNVDGYTGAGGVWTRTTMPTTLYAKWTPINYTISYDLAGGSVATPNPTGYTIESSAITLNNPTKTGYDFAGWTGTGLAEATTTVTIAAGSTGDRSYTATWTIKKYTVTWHVGESTSTTSNVEHFTTFSTLEASAPAHADNALAACGSTKFIGWVKAGGVWTDDGKTADWYNTYKYAAADEITSDVDIYAMYAEAGDPASDWTKYEESTLAEGDYLLIQSYSTYKVILKANVDGTPRFTKTTATITAGVVTSPDTKTEYIWRLSKSGNYYKFYNPNSGKYIVSTGTKSQADLVTTPTDDKDLFSVTYNTTDHYITITNKYNSTNSVNADFKYGGDYWACYSGTANIDLYWRAITYTNYRTGCTVSCSRPTPVAPASITKTGATISWTDPATSGTLDHYEYKVWEDGDDEPVSGTTNGTNLSKALTGLYSGVTYHWKVRRVCSGEDASIWASGSDFTTTAANLTYSVPDGASAVTTPTTTAGNLNSAEVPTNCGDCWSFAGWTTAAYAENSSAPATLFPAGTKAKVSGDATLHAVYTKSTYRIVGGLSEIDADEYYVISLSKVGVTSAMANTVVDTYYTTDEELPIKEDNTGAYIESPSNDVLWKFTGTTSAGRFQNVGNDKYLDLSNASNPPIAISTSDYVNITVLNASAKTFNIESNTTDGNYLVCYVAGWGVDADHDGYYSCRFFKRAGSTYATDPGCRTFTVTWNVNNGATTSTSNVTKCDAYLASLPSNPENNILDACIGSGKGRFVGWSPTKVMPAQDEIPAGMFDDVDDSPEITRDTTFYAVFAEEKTGGEAATNKTFTFTSKAWADETNSWSSDDDGDELTADRGVKVMKSGAGGGVADGTAAASTKSSYTSVTKVVVTYSTNAKDGAGTIGIKVNDVSYTGDASVTTSGGTSDRTIEYTPASAQTGTVKINVECTTNSIFIKSVQIFYTGSTTTYKGYRTACCNDPQLKFLDGEGDPTTEYVIVREDLASASTPVEIDCDISSLNTTEDITWKQTKRIKTDYHTANTWNASQTDRCQIDITNHKISAYETGSWQITIEQLMGSTNYCDGTATVNILVKTIDKFIDAVNGNFSGEPQSLEDTGNGILLPTEAMFSTNNGCSTTRRLIGWIKASDLATYASGRRVNMIDDLKTGDASNKVIAPGTKVQATGVTWYAVWGVEK